MFRLRWAAVCVLLACSAGFDVSAQAPRQEFLNQAILASTDITEEHKQQMLALIDKAVGYMTAEQVDAQAVTVARKTLLGPLRDQPASAECRESFSELLNTKMNALTGHDNALIRINTMILLGYMTDEASTAQIDTGLNDDNLAVRRKAIESLQLRTLRWLSVNAEDELDAVLAKVLELLGKQPAPHPVVVAPALEILLSVDQLALADQLNKRVAVHAADPNLSYNGEQSVLNQLGVWLQTPNNAPEGLSTSVNRAAYRYAVLITAQLKANRIDEDEKDGALRMLAQCFETLARVTAGAGKAAPLGLAETKFSLQNGAWDSIQSLLDTGWADVLKAEPFELTDDDLAAGS